MNKFLTWVFTAFLTFALILSMMATVSAFAATPELSDELASAPQAQQPLNSTPEARASEPAQSSSPQAAAPAPRTQARPAAKTVHLEDFQRIHQPVAQPRSTKMIWIGKSKRPN